CASSPAATLFKTPAVPAFSLASDPNLRYSVTGALVVARQSRRPDGSTNHNLPRLLVSVSLRLQISHGGSNQPRAPRPLVLCPQDGHRHFRRVRISGNAMVEQIFGSFLHLDIAGKRRHYRLADALRFHFVDHFDDDLREYHRRRDDRVPVTQNQ